MIPQGQRNVVLLSFILVVVFLFLGYQSYRNTEKTTLEEFNQRQLVLAEGAANGIELFFESIAGNLCVLKRNSEVQLLHEDKTRKAIHILFSELETRGVNDIGVLSADGVLKYNVTAPQIIGADFSRRHYFQDLRNAAFKKKYAVEFVEFKGADSGQQGVLIAVPMHDTNEAMDAEVRSARLSGVLICTVKLNVLMEKFVAPVKSSKRGHSYLLDDRCNVLWAPGKDLFGKNLLRETESFPSFQQVVEKMSTGASGVSEFTFNRFDEDAGRFLPDEEEEILMAHAPIHVGETTWSFGVWAPKKNARQLLQTSYSRQFLLVVLAVLSVIGGTSYAIAQSALSNRHLQRDIVKRQKAEEALRRSKEFFETILDSMNDAVSIVDVNNYRIIDVNEVFQYQYGLKKEEVIGRTCFEVTHHRLDPCSPPNDICPLVESMKTGGHAVAEHVHYLSGGEKVFMEVSTSPIKDEEGNIVKVIHVARDITERKLSEEALGKYARDLEEANRMKDLFTDIISHDLLNPIGVIRYFSEMLGEGHGKNTEEMTATIQRSASTIEVMLKNISKYSKVESIEKLEKSDLDLVQVLASVFERLESEAKSKNVTFQFDRKGEAMLVANPIIEDIFFNIFSNAIRYSPRNTRITVEISEGPESWIVSCSDEGEGVPEEYKLNIFERFERREKGGIKGTGLGLAIAKRVAYLHAGSIWIDDNPEGGSIFRVRLPKLAASPDGREADRTD